MARKKRSRRKTGRGKRSGRFRGWFRRLAPFFVIAAVISAGVFLYLYVEVTHRFENRLWDFPSGIYSASLSLSPGERFDPDALVRRLDRCGYGRSAKEPVRPGQYRRTDRALEVCLRPFQAPSADFGVRWRRIRFREGRVTAIEGRARESRRRVVFEPELLATLHGPEREDREILMYEDVEPRFLSAVLAAEDARFREHSGVDFLAVGRAALANLRHGKIVQGGSTITQQTVKNLYLGNERTWWRKIREIPMSLILEMKYSKERIFEVYLNEVYLGQRGSEAICGFQSASRFYFGRDLSDLTLSEQAILAGLIRSPGRLNPFRHPKAALARRDQVLQAMVNKGWLTGEEATRASREPLHLASGEKGFHKARYLVDFVRKDLGRFYDEEVLEQQGLKVFTTLDTLLQERAETILRKRLVRLERERPGLRPTGDKAALQGAVLFTRPLTGAVEAMVGGRDYRDTQFNRTVQSHRQPGSCFKPFVYLAGFESAIARQPGGLTPGTVLEDAPLSLRSDGKEWSPRNYERTYRGKVTVREALEESINVPAVRAGQRVGFDRVIETARRCGIRSRLAPWPSLALGSQEVTMMEMATAYGTLANGGLRAKPRIVEQVWNASNKPLQEREVDLHRAVDSRSAWLINNILQGVIDRGTARSSRALGYRGEAAGKTGTTDDTRDAWFVGYTPDRLGVVWVGYDDNRKTGLTGATGALPIWVEIEAGFEQGVTTRFRRPSGIVRRRIDPETGELATRRCPRRVQEYFAAGTEPERSCTVHGGKRKRWFRKLFGRG